MTKTNAYHIKLEGDNYTIGQKLGTMVQACPVLPMHTLSQLLLFQRKMERKF